MIELTTHACTLLAAISELKTIQFFFVSTNKWEDVDASTVLKAMLQIEDITKYRVAPKLIKIGNLDVVMPQRFALKYNTPYFIPRVDCSKLYSDHIWTDHNVDIERLNRGLVQLDADDAITHAIAMIKVSGGKT